jgi:hypothetical protein
VLEIFARLQKTTLLVCRKNAWGGSCLLHNQFGLLLGFWICVCCVVFADMSICAVKANKSCFQSSWVSQKKIDGTRENCSEQKLTLRIGKMRIELSISALNDHRGNNKCYKIWKVLDQQVKLGWLPFMQTNTSFWLFVTACDCLFILANPNKLNTPESTRLELWIRVGFYWLNNTTRRTQRSPMMT